MREKYYVAIIFILIPLFTVGQQNISQTMLYQECYLLCELSEKHRGLAVDILYNENIGNLEKRIQLSKEQYQKAIELYKRAIINKCNTTSNGNSSRANLIQCLISIEEYDEAQKELTILENSYRYDLHPNGPYNKDFFEMYFGILDRDSHYGELRKNGIVFHCGNSFTYMYSAKYQLELAIKRCKTLFKRKQWNYLTEYLHSLPISLIVEEDNYPDYYKVLNQFLAISLLEQDSAINLISQLENSSLQKSDINNVPYFSMLYFKPNTHHLKIGKYYFGLRLKKDLLIENEMRPMEIINDLELTRKIRNAIYKK